MHTFLKFFVLLFSLFLFISCKDGTSKALENKALLAETNIVSSSKKFNPNDFLGLWQSENGEDAIRIEKNDTDFLLIWKSKADNYEPH